MVVFFDIDGTLVDDATQIIPESTVQAIRLLQENGHIAVINSGRPYTHIDPRVRAMNFQGFVCGCGTEVRYRDRWLSRHHPEPQVCRYVRDCVRQCNMQVVYEHRDGMLLLDGRWSSHPACVQESGRMARRGFTVRQLDSLPEPEFMKFVTLDSLEGCEREKFLELVSPWFDYIVRDHTLVEYMLKGCSKAGGMEVLLNHLGVSREDTLAVGDSTNDLPMFLAAGHTACMGNGMQALKERSEFITGSVLEDGVETALRHFGLI